MAWRRVVTQDDFDRFARLSGDDNPIHVDPVFAAGTRFGRTVAHGMMLYSLVVQLIRTQLVPGAVEVAAELKFPGPTFAGDEVCIRAEVVAAGGGEVEIAAQVETPSGIGCEARVRVRRV